MIWQNPWAWLGLAAVGVPVAVHLLARRRAARVPFPTLRFLDASSRLSVRWERLTDYAVLAVRTAIVLAAVAALAQPFLMTASRRHDAGANLTRAIVVDASASMQRPTPAGGTAIAEARTQAQARRDGATASRIMEAADLPSAIAGAAAWLAPQPGRHELLVISDFQQGAVTAADLAGIPAGTGIRIIRVATVPPPAIVMPPARGLTSATTATAQATATGTAAAWTTRAGAASPDPSIVLLAGPNESSGAEAAREAARAGGLPDAPPDRPIAIVFPGADERAELLARVSLVDRPWMFDVMSRLNRDATLAAAARAARATTSDSPWPAGRTTVVARDADGQPLVAAAAGDVGGTHRLVVFSMADAASVTSASLFAGLARAASTGTPLSELEPATIPADDTARWERAPTDVAPPAGRPGDASDGRWLWAAALVLLAAEFLLRRRPLEVPVTHVVHDRVA